MWNLPPNTTQTLPCMMQRSHSLSVWGDWDVDKFVIFEWQAILLNFYFSCWSKLIFPIAQEQFTQGIHVKIYGNMWDGKESDAAAAAVGDDEAKIITLLHMIIMIIHMIMIRCFLVEKISIIWITLYIYIYITRMFVKIGNHEISRRKMWAFVLQAMVYK